MAHRAVRAVVMRLSAIVYPVARFHWRRLGGAKPCVRVFVRHGDAVLLVRHSYGPDWWILPGGAAARGEPLEAAARREVREEVGVALRAVVAHGQVPNPVTGRWDGPWLFSAEVDERTIDAEDWEIREARWFGIEEVLASRLRVAPGLAQWWEMLGYGARTEATGRTVAVRPPRGQGSG
jgi:ADP-ribose pyrophosphatase YjhB (NUDIX family)